MNRQENLNNLHSCGRGMMVMDPVYKQEWCSYCGGTSRGEVMHHARCGKAFASDDLGAFLAHLPLCDPEIERAGV